MCKNNKVVGRWMASGICTAGLLYLTTAGVQGQSPGGCQGNGSNSQIGFLDPITGAQVSTVDVHIGATVCFYAQVGVNGTACDATGVNAFVKLPNGNTVQILNNANIAQGQTITCPGSSQCVEGPTDLCYQVRCIDLGKTISLSLTAPRGSSVSPSVNPGPLQFGAVVAAVGTAQTGGTGNDFTAGNTATGDVEVPCISITKRCVNLLTPAGEPIQFTGEVCNTGTIALTGITITDDPASSDIALPADFGGALAPGQCITYTGSYTPAECGPNTDTISVTATDALGAPVSSTGACVLVRNAAGEITGVNCDAAPPDPVTAICEVDCPPHIIVIKEVICAPPGCGSLPTPAAKDSPYHTATGVKIVQLDDAGNEISHTCPKFCYRLVVINDGGQDVVVDSITDVATPSNSALDFSGTCIGIPGVGGTLAKGDTYTCIIDNVELCESTVNTFTVNGHGSIDNVAVTDSDADTVTIKTLNIECTKLVSTAPGFGENNGESDLTLIDTGAPATVHYAVRIHKSGDADVAFSSVTVTDPDLPGPGTPTTDPCPATITLSEIDLAFLNAGTDVTVPICDVDFTCAALTTPFVNSVTVTGIPAGTVGETPACLPVDTSGNPVAATHTCSATVRCTVVPAASCRYTGGGVLLPNEVTDTSDCPVPNTTVSGPNCNGKTAVKITHGGQLGAPYANAGYCASGTILPNGDPCIRGQLEHVRHYQGKNNPSTVVAVDNFHSNTPLGIFDMVQCACLPCCEAGVGGATAANLRNLCNPDDKKICGPQPSGAPANALITTGIGCISTCLTSNGKGTPPCQLVLFRLYVVDRSEPGGGFPGGQKAPPDVYCFQAWALNGQIDSATNLALRKALADESCAFIASGTGAGGNNLPPTSSLGTPIINDCGGQHTGNLQIHPSTSATCP